MVRNEGRRLAESSTRSVDTPDPLPLIIDNHLPTETSAVTEEVVGDASTVVDQGSGDIIELIWDLLSVLFNLAMLADETAGTGRIVDGINQIALGDDFIIPREDAIDDDMAII